MRNARLYIRIVAWILVLTTLALFVVQNQERTTDLSLDLYVFAVHLARPLPVTWLLLGVFATGALVGGLYGYLKGRGSSSGYSRPDKSADGGDAWT